MVPYTIHFRLPDLLSLCPLKTGNENPHYALAAAESTAWITSFNILAGRKLELFLRAHGSELCSRAYPYAPYEQFRTCCDFVNLLFVLDEISDDQNEQDARKTMEVSLNVMRGHAEDDGSPLAQMTRELRTRLLKSAHERCIQRLIRLLENYVEAVIAEAALRHEGRVLDLDSFITLRRENSAVRVCFAFFEYILDIDLPEAVFEDPAFMRVYWAAIDMVWWANDVYSYAMEANMGHHGNNIVTVLMKNKGFDLQAAADYVGVYFAELMTTFVEGKKGLRSWGLSVDADVAQIIEAQGQWVVGNLEASDLLELIHTLTIFFYSHSLISVNCSGPFKLRDTSDVMLLQLNRILSSTSGLQMA
ncbi:hypothetical protein PLICRDRAFT_108725 [Plicaturopsis crispa FD-325 SS-3]|nr:hypothetical protein PLICRDRAFT_108725 [Plicaturopsis crispa FD-325 SS-3]